METMLIRLEKITILSTQAGRDGKNVYDSSFTMHRLKVYFLNLCVLYNYICIGVYASAEKRKQFSKCIFCKLVCTAHLHLYICQCREKNTILKVYFLNLCVLHIYLNYSEHPRCIDIHMLRTNSVLLPKKNMDFKLHRSTKLQNQNMSKNFKFSYEP